MSHIFAPNEVFQDGRLSKMQLRVLLGLWSFKDHKSNKPIHPKRATLAGRVGYSVAVISRTTTQLAKLGWLTKVGNSGGRSSSAIYQLHIPDCMQKEAGNGYRIEHKTVTEPVTKTDTGSVRGNKQTINQTTITDMPAGAAQQESKPVQAEEPIVCDVFILQDEKQKIEKPEAVSTEAYQQLMPALKTLPVKRAAQVLGLLNMAVQDGSIKTTQQRLGGAYIKAARNETLDVSRLEKAKKPVQTHPSQVFWKSERKPQTEADKASRAAGLANLEALLKSMG